MLVVMSDYREDYEQVQRDLVDILFDYYVLNIKTNFFEELLIDFLKYSRTSLIRRGFYTMITCKHMIS